MIPLHHDFRGARVLVFGGGPVGARRARTFDREARVIVVSPTFAPADFGESDRIRARPASEDVGTWIDRVDPALVVAATDDRAVNRAVASAARTRGVLVNRADAAAGMAGAVDVPAIIRDGPVTASVATDGVAPALSRVLRERVESALDGAGTMAAILEEEQTNAGGSDGSRTAGVDRIVGAETVWAAIREGDEDRARRLAAALRSNDADTAGSGD